PLAAAEGLATASQHTPLPAAAPGVLGNDADIDSATITANLVAGPAHGTLTLNANGSFTYTPATSFSGTDSFTYTASDGTAQSGLATVTIVVNAVNHAPVGKDDAYSVNEDTVLTVATPGVLGNDTDSDGNALTAVLVAAPAHGTLTLNANGSFTFTPAANYNGPDSFTYKANDGSLDSNVATVAITLTAVNAPPVAAHDSFSTNDDT